MAKRDTLFKFAGITVHTGNGGEVVRAKVRYGTDFVMRFKQLNSPKKIEDKRLGICLTPARVDLIELPEAMLKIDALKFLLTHENFQSPEDQALIQEAIDTRTPKEPRKPRKARTVKVKADKKAAPSLDSIKSRAKKVDITPEAVLAAAGVPVEAVAEPAPVAEVSAPAVEATVEPAAA